MTERSLGEQAKAKIKGSSEATSDSAWLILGNALHGGPSGLDEDTITWSKRNVAELARSAGSIQESTDFGAALVNQMRDANREVSLLAVELLALALLPVKSVSGENEDLFSRLVAAVFGDPVAVPEALVAGIAGPGRWARTDDGLGDRFLWLVKFAETYGTCPDFDWLVESGDDEYIGHEDLHEQCLYEFVHASPWAAAEFSNRVPADCQSMRYDLDHMLWPEDLAPPHIREDAHRILGDNFGLLRESSGKSEIGILKDLYLLKDLLGSWSALSPDMR